MKLLVSKRTKTLVPTKASVGVSMRGCSGTASRSGVATSMSGLAVPSSRMATGGFAPSANVETFCRIPSSRIRKSFGFSPLM
jgi:hypothetical protein